MKIEKSNNPAAVGALIVVLVLIVGRIVWMLFGQNKAVSAASTVAAPPSTPTAAPVSEAVRPHTQAALLSTPVTIPVTTRNPFTCPVPVRTVPVPSHSDGGFSSGKARGVGAVSLFPLPPLPIHAVKTYGSVGAGSGSSSVPGLPGMGALPVHTGQSVSAQTGSKALPVTDPSQTLKLTAIVDGAEPMAVVQTADPTPVVLHVGDVLEGMRVIAID
jgi:hypothetical protein